jgi:phosphatidylserine/phosphatidylglycerophosphate/cardiolipin synthase-like enzyme
MANSNRFVTVILLALVPLALAVGIIAGGALADRSKGDANTPTSGTLPAATPSAARASAAAPAGSAPAAGDIAVHFSPGGGCTQAIVAEIDRARESVLVQAYSFTSRPIGKALVDAHRRGVPVTVILDAENARDEHFSEADFLSRAGIPVYLDAQHAIAHEKIMLIDGKVLITGSFNFTRAAEERNAENLLVIQATAALGEAYQSNFRRHLAHSERYNK